LEQFRTSCITKAQVTQMPDTVVQDSKEKSSGSRRLRPKPALCRAKSIVGNRVVECVVQPQPNCYYAMGFGKILLCTHRERADIVARTQAGQKPPPQ
jgi:hypothetical protein